MGSASDLFQRAVIALSDEDFDRAEKLTKELLDKDKSNVDGWGLLANIYQQSNQSVKAIEAAKKATELDPENLQHWNNLGFLYLSQSQWKEGEKCYAKAEKLPNPSPTIFLNHAWALIELEQERAAIQKLKESIERALEDTITETINSDKRYTKLRPLLKKMK
ncbi:MAG: tetratricopeptide repeat protein [Candidatus Hodarchaeota archaeon]